MKAGTNFTLPVTIKSSTIPFENICGIEFLFKQAKTGKAKKTAYWSRDGNSRGCVKLPNEAKFLVEFSREDTYRFYQNEVFFLDVRIHLDGTLDNPQTNIVPIHMSETLFAEGEEVSPDEP